MSMQMSIIADEFHRTSTSRRLSRPPWCGKQGTFRDLSRCRGGSPSRCRRRSTSLWGRRGRRRQQRRRPPRSSRLLCYPSTRHRRRWHPARRQAACSTPKRADLERNGWSSHGFVFRQSQHRSQRSIYQIGRIILVLNRIGNKRQRNVIQNIILKMDLLEMTVTESLHF